jgi:lipopolysaccharide biosynthesis glycosyltransferase
MKVFVGYDPREDIAYRVCEFSIKARSVGVEVIPLKQSELREAGIYTRVPDTLSSTEFTFTRFLVPHLADYSGWAIFVDCDFLFQCDVTEIFNQADDRYAVMCVKHDYTPQEGDKMDGCKQLPYPRKNWSSMILWNCGHPANADITPELVNNENNSGQFFHRFQWLSDDQIGELSQEYNWLVNWYHEPQDGHAKAIHYTEGGPWFENYKHCEYGYQWAVEHAAMIEASTPPPVSNLFTHIPKDIETVFKKILKYRVDPSGEIYNTTVDNVIEDIKMLDNNTAIAVDGIRDPNDGKGLGWDPYMESFILGCGGQLTNYDKIVESKIPVVFRGITKAKHMRACAEQGRDYYYIDTGYFGNARKKFFHRITKNAMQNTGPIIERPFDRLEATGWHRSKFRKGNDILLCPPSAKAMSAFGLDLDIWMQETIATIKTYTDRKIVIRNKVSRRERTATDTMEMALSRNVHCLVTFNSIAATEAILLGKPAFALGPNAAHAVSLSDLSQIETPKIPTVDELEAWAAHLAYCQFSEAEMKDGTAWSILNEDGKIWVPTQDE